MCYGNSLEYLKKIYIFLNIVNFAQFFSKTGLKIIFFNIQKSQITLFPATVSKRPNGNPELNLTKKKFLRLAAKL